ncbi:hypothetical protein U9R62_07860 [Cylindrospermopsis raciborskii DSH]|uniref:hypothetical protein n=1 Tax=Cylindrospermopsis raciborskii TaxID=77022 RepID=UPI002ED77A77
MISVQVPHQIRFLAINYATAKGVKLTNNSWGGEHSQALYDAINAAGQAGLYL